MGLDMVEAIRYIVELTMCTMTWRERGGRERGGGGEREVYTGKSHITFTEHECKHYYTVINSLKVTGVFNVFTSSPTH